MTNNVVAALSTLTDVVSADFSNYAANLPNEQVTQLHVLTAEFRSSQKLIANEIIVSGTKLAQLQELLGDQFFNFAERELGLHRRTIMRYLTVAKVVKQHFSTGDKINLKEVSNYTQSALLLLAPAEESLIDEVKALAGTGQPINEKVVKELMAKVSEQDERVRLAEAEAESARSQLSAAQKDHELAQARQTSLNARTDERLLRAEELNRALQEENAQLRKAETIVEEKLVPTLPKEFATLQDAVAQESAKLKTVQDAVAKAQREAKQTEERIEEVRAEFAALSQQSADLKAVQQKIEELLRDLPVANLQALSANDPNAKAALGNMGKLLIQLGESLRDVAIAD
jgi:hypothetical protein